MAKKQYKERRIYFAGQCTNCEHPFQSFKRSRIKAGLCKKCRKLIPPKGQDSLFMGESQFESSGAGEVQNRVDSIFSQTIQMMGQAAVKIIKKYDPKIK